MGNMQKSWTVKKLQTKKFFLKLILLMQLWFTIHLMIKVLLTVPRKFLNILVVGNNTKTSTTDMVELYFLHL